MTLYPRLSSLDLDRLGLEYQEAPRRCRFSVIDIQVGRHRDIVRQGSEAASGQPFVQHGRQISSMDDSRVTAEVLAHIGHADEGLALALDPSVRRDNHLSGTEQRTAGETAGAVRAGHLHMRARLRKGWVRAEFSKERVFADHVLGHVRLVVVGCESCQAGLVRVEAHAVGVHRIPRSHGSDGAECHAYQPHRRRAAKGSRCRSRCCANTFVSLEFLGGDRDVSESPGGALLP